MVVEFITTYAMSAYHHLCCEFESRSGEVYSIQHYVIKFVSDLRQVGGLLQVLWFPPPIKLTYNWCYDVWIISWVKYLPWIEFQKLGYYVKISCPSKILFSVDWTVLMIYNLLVSTFMSQKSFCTQFINY
jgi:hypothetical protein